MADETKPAPKTRAKPKAKAVAAPVAPSAETTAPIQFTREDF